MRTQMQPLHPVQTTSTEPVATTNASHDETLDP
jgi:hypothetical protein